MFVFLLWLFLFCWKGFDVGQVIKIGGGLEGSGQGFLVLCFGLEIGVLGVKDVQISEFVGFKFGMGGLVS